MKIRLKNLKESFYNNEFGNAAVEYILILSIISTIVLVLLLITLNLNNQFVTSTCRINCSITESQYKSYLNQIGATHSDTLLEHYIMTTGNEVCPEHNGVTYINGKLQCSVHFENTDMGDGDNSGDTVPFL